MNLDVLITAFREAFEAKGDPFTKKAYNEWREEQLERDPSRRLPTADTIADRFGGWKAAHLAILGKPRDRW